MIITGKDNPKIKELKKLYSSKKEREKQGLFVIEGMRGCIDAVMSCVLDKILDIFAVFYVKDAVEYYSEYLPVYLLDEIPPENKFEITRDIAEKISETKTSQGIFVVAKKLDKSFSEDIIAPNGKYLILDDLQDPGNLGTMLRTADAAGVDGVVLTGECVDMYNPKVVRSSMGSLPRINVYIEKDYEKALDILKSCNIKISAAVVEGGTSISKYDFSGGHGVVIGNEGKGLAHDKVQLCDDKITIEMRGHMDSLNAAVAGTIFLWEMMKGK